MDRLLEYLLVQDIVYASLKCWIQSNINDAMLSSTAPTFFRATVQGNIAYMDLQIRHWFPGRKYAWQVTALDEFLRDNRTSQGTAFRNGGRSEVTWIYWQKQDQQQTTLLARPFSQEAGQNRSRTKPGILLRQLNVTAPKETCICVP